MAFEFEKSELWQMALRYVDALYEIADILPINEEKVLKVELRRVGTHLANHLLRVVIAENDYERVKAISGSLRLLMETVAHMQIVKRREMIAKAELLDSFYRQAELIEKHLQTLRQTIGTKQITGKQRLLLGVKE